jgi:mRNA-degrading endonuclease toxin of MazEF toxin-antitoxin module
VSLTNIETVFRGYLTRQITTLGPDRMAQICEALKIAVAC